MDDIKEPPDGSQLAALGTANIYNRQLLAADLADETGLPRSTALTVVDATFGAISQALHDGKEVRIAGFGSFLPSERTGRTGMNPRTGEVLDVPEPRTVRFRAGKLLRDLLSGRPV